MADISREERDEKSLTTVIEKIDKIQERISRKQTAVENGIICGCCGARNVPAQRARVLHDANSREYVVCGPCGRDLYEAGFRSAPFSIVKSTQIEELVEELERLKSVGKFIKKLHETGKMPIFPNEDPDLFIDID